MSCSHPALNCVLVPCAETFFHSGALFNPSWDDATKSKFTEMINSKLTFLKKNYIGQDPYLNPQQPSIACIYLYIVLTWAGFLGISLDSYPKTKQFVEQVGQNPKIKSAQEKMNAGSK